MGDVEGRVVGRILRDIEGRVVGSLGDVRTRVRKDSIVQGEWGSWVLPGELEGRLRPPRRLWWAAEKSVVLLVAVLVAGLVVVAVAVVLILLVGLLPVVLEVGVGPALAVDLLRVV